MHKLPLPQLKSTKINLTMVTSTTTISFFFFVFRWIRSARNKRVMRQISGKKKLVTDVSVNPK